MQTHTWDGTVGSLRWNLQYLWGIDLFNGGYFWEAHEAWEELWRLAPLDSIARVFLQGLIQCAAALLKLRTGHMRGAQQLAARGLQKLKNVSRVAAVCAGVAIDPLCVGVRDLCQVDVREDNIGEEAGLRALPGRARNGTPYLLLH